MLVELPDRLDHRDPKVKKERKVILESKDPRVIPAQLELRARRAIQERKDHRVIRAYKGKLAQKEIPERLDHKAPKVTKEYKE